MERQAAWGLRAKTAARWPASLAVLAALALYMTLPDTLVFGANLAYGAKWILPLLEGALLVPLTFIWPHRHSQEGRWQRWTALALIALVNAANVGSLALLVQQLLYGTLKANGVQLIVAAVPIWLTNVLVFALWYWELDRGGPGARCAAHHREPDFLFPQMVTPEAAPQHWTPAFIDYLYVSFTNAMAFSPTDTMPLTGWAKSLMLAQSMASLLLIALVAARAVNILNG